MSGAVRAVDSQLVEEVVKQVLCDAFMVDSQLLDVSLQLAHPEIDRRRTTLYSLYSRNPSAKGAFKFSLPMVLMFPT